MFMWDTAERDRQETLGGKSAVGWGQKGCWGFQRDLLAVLRDDLDLSIPC